VVGIELLAYHRAGDVPGIETTPGVSDHNDYAATLVATDTDLYACVRVVLAAVGNRVGQRLLQHELDVELLAYAAPHLLDSGHDPLDNRCDGLDFSRYRQVETEDKVLAVEFATG
jgi:hypothetical protein